MTAHDVKRVKEVLIGAMDLTDTPENRKLVKDTLDILVEHIDEPNPDLSYINAETPINP